MTLLDLLFGKKKTVTDSMLGAFVSGRMRGENPHKQYSWYGGYLMPNAPEESSVILEGNNVEPSPSQLIEVKSILKNLDQLWAKVDLRLDIESKSLSLSEREVFRNWRSIFYLAAIHPLENNTKPNFEICFDPIDKDSLAYMIFSYSGGELTEIEISAPKQTKS